MRAERVKLAGLFGQSEGRAQVRLARVFGIDVRMHASFLVAFALVLFALGSGVLPADWSPVERWVTALVTAVLFSASLLAHELSHARVAIAYGVEVPRITLFIFGGMAELSREPPTPKIEFLVAAAGPLMSFLLAVLFLVIGGMFLPADWDLAEPQALITELSPPAFAALQLAGVNFVLAVFNLIPGFPLDGGRLFRALLWWRTGDLVRATEHAAAVGKGVGWVFVGIGAYRASTTMSWVASGWC